MDLTGAWQSNPVSGATDHDLARVRGYSNVERNEGRNPRLLVPSASIEM